MRATWAPFFLLAAMGLPALAKPPSQDHFALAPAQVARALSAGGMQTSKEQVSLPATVVATEPDPALDVLLVEPAGKQGSRVKLACHVSGDCLPFYVMVQVSSPAGFGRSLVGGRAYTMRAGTRATLVMDDARAHIQVKVISLENGMAGKRIRASSLDRKQIYFAEVVSASLLKGIF